jgi:hypothetical protein
MNRGWARAGLTSAMEQVIREIVREEMLAKIREDNLKAIEHELDPAQSTLRSNR